MLSPQKGLRLNLEMAFNDIVLLAERVKDVGGVLTLLWHPDQIINSVYVKAYKKRFKIPKSPKLLDGNCKRNWGLVDKELEGKIIFNE